MRGTVTAFDAHMGLGDITIADGTVVMFHCAEIVDGTRDINIGESVSFVVAHRFGLVEASEIEKLPS